MQILHWTIVHWEKLGRKIGFPTANIACETISEANSVFCINIVIDGNIHYGVWAHLPHKKTFEVHIFDFTQDIYGKDVEIILLHKIRENQKFDSLEELTQQIRKDIEYAKNINLHVLSFWSFDVLHPGHEHYLFSARKYWKKLITIVATDENIKRIKGNPPLYPLPQRTEALMKTGIPHEVVAGSDENPLKWLEIYTPHCICLGYDQRGKFVDRLPEKLSQLGIDAKIIRADALKPNMYKSSLLKKKK